MLTSLLFSSICLSATVYSQTTSTSSNYLGVSTDAPIPGNYTGAYRPQIHFSPPKGFMNDPNGMFFDAEGTAHLYYQYNPTGLVAGKFSFPCFVILGHATSKDLYTWTNQPIAILPINSSSLIFSGSAVVDVNNTSGFFPKNQTNGVVAIFTIATSEPVTLQSQGLAYSFDNGYTFTMYEGNPILDLGLANFRDPKVSWYEDHWVMVVAYATAFSIGVFTSPDLKKWTHASDFTHHGILGYAYECPNLVEVPYQTMNGSANGTLWLLQVSINPGAPQGGSATQYFPGTFDGYTFTPVDEATRFIDFGKDNYAGQFFYNTPAAIADSVGPIAIDWTSNWQYAQTVPTGPSEGWRSAMSLPRTVVLRQEGSGDGIDIAFISPPFVFDQLLGEQLLPETTLTNTSTAIDFSSIYSNAVYFVAEARDDSGKYPTGGTLNFTFLSPISGESLQCGVFFGAEQPVFVNRGGTRAFDNPFFTDKFSTSTFNGVGKVQGVIDRSVFEVFLNGGERSGTSSFFSEEPLTILSIASSEVTPSNMTVSVTVWELLSTWREQEDAFGIVLGNTTSTTENVTKREHGRVLYEAHF